jgi:hypothetical protein
METQTHSLIQGCFILALHWMQMRIESGKSLIAC